MWLKVEITQRHCEEAKGEAILWSWFRRSQFLLSKGLVRLLKFLEWVAKLYITELVPGGNHSSIKTLQCLMPAWILNVRGIKTTHPHDGEAMVAGHLMPQGIQVQLDNLEQAFNALIVQEQLKDEVLLWEGGFIMSMQPTSITYYLHACMYVCRWWALTVDTADTQTLLQFLGCLDQG